MYFLRGMPQGFPRVSAMDEQEIENYLYRNKLLTFYEDEKRLSYRGKMSWKNDWAGKPQKSVCVSGSYEESCTRLSEFLKVTNFRR